MPIPIVIKIIRDGFDAVPWALPWLKFALVVGAFWALKRYFQGAANLSERNLHGKVIVVTGGTAGVGAEVVRELATRGAQIVLLTQHPVGDLFLVDYIEDLRSQTSNELITAEQVDLSSLHSIRVFATKWIDNAPPRRLDMVILCANTLTPRGAKLQSTDDGVEVNWAINYLANFHLLSILSPAIRAQPPDRDVRIIMGTCVSYLGGQLPFDESNAEGKTKTKSTKAAGSVSAAAFNPSQAYASSKLALTTFAHSFQKHLSSYVRPDKQPTNARVILVDPGFCRTPGMRRYLSWGSLTGLALYLIMYPLWWLLLKSPPMGAQTFLFAAMEEQFGRGQGGWLLKECQETKMGRQDVLDEDVQKALWKHSEDMVTEAEKRGAVARAVRKRQEEQASAEKAATGKQPEKKQATETSGAAPKKGAAQTSRRSRKAA